MSNILSTPITVDFPKIKTFPDKNFVGKYCASPFISIEITCLGGVRMCGCADWMPTTIGNIFESSIHDLLSSSLAQDIRNSIIKGSFTYCNEKTCGTITNQQLVDFSKIPDQAKHLIADSKKFIMPSEIYIAGDSTCNLSCPSCRNEVVKNSPEQIEKLKILGNKIKQNLFSIPTSQPISITLSTSGELFASPLLLEFINNIDCDNYPNLTLNIQTNGLLAKKNWNKLNQLKNRVKKITVSIDAATKETYEKLRRGGKWENLVEALEFFSAKKQELGLELVTRMVVQQANYLEIPEFYKMSKHYHADLVEYVKIINWNIWSNENFFYHDVANVKHPEFKSLKQILNTLEHISDVKLVRLHHATDWANKMEYV